MPYVAALLIVIAITLFFIAARQRRKAGIPAGRVIFSDTNQWGKLEKPLYDPGLHLTGKPDYLVEQGEHIIPVEVKSGQGSHGPAEWHILQLAAYCLLVEHEYGSRPRYGIIHYQKRTYAVEFTRSLEEITIDTIQTMQKRASQFQVDRSHQDPWRCQHCGYRSICDQSLRI